MKHPYFFAISLVLLLLLSTCQNTTDPNITEETHNVSIDSGEVFEYQTGISGDEEAAEIVQHPKRYKTSTIVRDSTTSWEAVYTFEPEIGFQGTGLVTLKLSTNSDGAGPNTKVNLVTLNITVN